MRLEKKYDLISDTGKTESIKVTIIYGFDEKILNNFSNGNDEMLFMFVSNSDENFDWFFNNVNTNPNIVVMKSTIDEDIVKIEIFEKIVDKMFEQQNEALKIYYSNKDNKI